MKKSLLIPVILLVANAGIAQDTKPKNPIDAVKEKNQQQSTSRKYPLKTVMDTVKRRNNKPPTRSLPDIIKDQKEGKAPGTSEAERNKQVEMQKEKNANPGPNVNRGNKKGGPPSWAPAWGRRRKDGTLNEYEGKKKEYKERRDDDDDDKNGEGREKGKGKGKGNGKKDD